MKKLKKGQKVKVIGDSVSHNYGIGRVLTIKEEYSNKKGYIVEEGGNWVAFTDIKKHDSSAPVKFLLKYDLRADPVEECSSLEEVKERIEQLVKDKDKNGLKLDSIVVYELKSIRKITVETKVEIKGI